MAVIMSLSEPLKTCQESSIATCSTVRDSANFSVEASISSLTSSGTTVAVWLMNAVSYKQPSHIVSNNLVYRVNIKGLWWARSPCVLQAAPATNDCWNVGICQKWWRHRFSFYFPWAGALICVVFIPLNTPGSLQSVSFAHRAALRWVLPLYSWKRIPWGKIAFKWKLDALASLETQLIKFMNSYHIASLSHLWVAFELNRAVAVAVEAKKHNRPEFFGRWCQQKQEKSPAKAKTLQLFQENMTLTCQCRHLISFQIIHHAYLNYAGNQWLHALIGGISATFRAC